MTRSALPPTLKLIALGAAGGGFAAVAHLPMPWMLGALVSTATLVRFRPQNLPEDYAFPLGLRLAFIAVIGLTIGLQVTPALMRQLPDLAISLIAITIFVPVAQIANYWLFRRLGGYDPVTAFFAGSPGGLLESLLVGEKHGAEVARLTVQQFLRIIVVITLLPTVISIWVGHPVGSAAGLAGQMPQSALPLVPTLCILALAGGIGSYIGRQTALPAGQLTGPLVCALILNMTPVPAVAMPAWALIAAQVVIGASLGARFHGVSRDMLVRGLGLAILSVAVMLGIGLALIAVVLSLGQHRFDVLFISFAPGGVTEMGLIAITLAASPAVVALHHIYRIVLTVALMVPIARRIGALSPRPSPSG